MDAPCSYHALQDKNPDNRDAASAKFKDISEAYEVRCCSNLAVVLTLH